jgi:hypothetical protein
MNIDTIIEGDYAGKTWHELSEAPLTALRGLSGKDAQALGKAFGICTIGDLAELKYVRWAHAIAVLASAERATTEQTATEESIDEAVEMSFPASDPMAISGGVPH